MLGIGFSVREDPQHPLILKGFLVSRYSDISRIGVLLADRADLRLERAESRLERAFRHLEERAFRHQAERNFRRQEERTFCRQEE